METNTYKMHFSAYVSDISKTIEFYNKFFGVEPVKQRKDYVKYDIDNPGLVASFVLNPDKVLSDFGHLGFRVDSQDLLLQRRQVVIDHGLEVEDEMRVTCCYAEQDKFWVRDPDGIAWEVYHFKSDADSLNDENKANAACCVPRTVQEKEVSACCQGEACGC